MKDLIFEIVKALVDQPEEVSVNEIGGSHTTVLELRVAKTDSPNSQLNQGIYRDSLSLDTLFN